MTEAVSLRPIYVEFFFSKSLLTSLWAWVFQLTNYLQWTLNRCIFSVFEKELYDEECIFWG